MIYEPNLVNRPALDPASKLLAVANAPAASGGCDCSASAEVDAGLCPVSQPEFPRFFAGQCVQPDDLTGIEKRVFVHEQLRARHTIGWGISCGFRVGLDGTVTQQPANLAADVPATVQLSGAMLRVEGGYGIDRFGRDVYLADTRKFSLETLLAEREARIKKAMADPWCAIPGCQPTPPTHYCVAVRYRECPDKPVPSYGQQCGTPKTVCEYSRIREDVEIRVFGDNEFPEFPTQTVGGQWCGLPEADAALMRVFLNAIQIPHGTTDVASSAASGVYTSLAANVGTVTATDTIERGSCEDLLHLSRPCEPCVDWPWIPLACFTIQNGTVTAPDCRVRRTIYSLQEIEALVIRIFCLLVHGTATNENATGTNVNLRNMLDLFR